MAAPRHSRDDPRPGGFAGNLVFLAEDLRAEGVSAGTSELMDAVSALAEVAWTAPEDVREALAATLAKSPEDRKKFDLVFDRFLFRASEEAALREDVQEGAGQASDEAAGEQPAFDEADLREAIMQAIRDGDESAMRDLARLAITAFGQRGQGSGVIGVDVQRIRRSLGLRSDPQPADSPAGEPRREGLPREQLRRFEQLLRRELERGAIERNRQLPPSRPLSDLDRGLPGNSLQDLQNVHKVVTQLKRRLKTQGQENRGRKRHAQIDVRRTMRACLPSAS